MIAWTQAKTEAEFIIISFSAPAANVFEKAADGAMNCSIAILMHPIKVQRPHVSLCLSVFQAKNKIIMLKVLRDLKSKGSNFRPISDEAARKRIAKDKSTDVSMPLVHALSSSVTERVALILFCQSRRQPIRYTFKSSKVHGIPMCWSFQNSGGNDSERLTIAHCVFQQVLRKGRP